eukprot:m.197847 g.197847  ORF g.197847 m.197847 type:complete len:204 (-) comp17671_c1_seq1:664-1275(-)
MATAKVVLVGGESGSGKTTLARRLSALLPITRLFNQDDYYKSPEEVLRVEGHPDWLLWDDVSALDQERFAADVSAAGGLPSNFSSDDAFTTAVAAAAAAAAAATVAASDSSSHVNYNAVSATTVIIVEGTMVFQMPWLCNLASVGVWVDTPRDVCTHRRAQRSYDLADPPGYVENVVWPAADHALRAAKTFEADRPLIRVVGM